MCVWTGGRILMFLSFVDFKNLLCRMMEVPIVEVCGVTTTPTPPQPTSICWLFLKSNRKIWSRSPSTAIKLEIKVLFWFLELCAKARACVMRHRNPQQINRIISSCSVNTNSSILVLGFFFDKDLYFHPNTSWSELCVAWQTIGGIPFFYPVRRTPKINNLSSKNIRRNFQLFAVRHTK